MQDVIQRNPLSMPFQAHMDSTASRQQDESVGSIQGRTIKLFTDAQTSVQEFAHTIYDFIFENSHHIFFVLSSILAAANFQNLFLIGMATGTVGGIVCGSLSNRIFGNNFYLCRQFTYEAAVAQLAFASLATFEKVLSFVSFGHVGLGDSISSSLLSGIIAGVWAASASALCIDSIRSR